MVKIAVKDNAGKDVREINLKESVFGLPANDALLHQVYVALTGNIRQAIAHTKDRGERAGSGKKPWRQKGTGRARVGSVRSPIWRKGGVTFGPTKDRNFSKNTNKKMRRIAIMVALSEKVRGGKLMVLESLTFKNETEKKTKHFAGILKNLSIGQKSLAIGLSGSENESLRIMRNLPKVEAVPTENLSILELLNREFLLLTPAGIVSLEKRLGGVSKTEKKEVPRKNQKKKNVKTSS